MAEIIQLQEKGVLRYVATHVDGVAGLDKHFAKSGKSIFKGAVYFMDGQKYTFDLDEIKESLVLVFGRYEPGTGALGYGYTVLEVNKIEIPKRSGKLRSVLLGMSSNPTFKQFYVSENAVWGHADNANGDRNGFCLEEVYLN